MDEKLASLSADIQAFCTERDWEQFHNPKNLAIALSVEASELLEVFQWLTPEQSQNLSDTSREQVRDELGDVLICLLNFAHRVGLDPIAAAQQKLEKIKAKYPVEKAKGLAKKYNDLD
jgi:NTP pyrophosphatase (non-canonical NTP hydrolase)